MYDLQLRRMVIIKNAQLQSVETEYDFSGVTLEGDVVDPFLVSVLRDKRKNHHLSDIIRTIQQNQNEIVERPIDESFAVQGCAGSGKTMILLHRLSYLAFNHPEIDFSKYFIITPNESFNRHIDELCEQLELGEMPRCTVEEYYGRVVEKLSRPDVYYPNKTSKGLRSSHQKITPFDTPLRSEMGINSDYLERVYSDDFLERISDCFLELSDLAFEQLESSGATELFASRGLEDADEDASLYMVYRNLVNRCEKVRREADEAARSFDEKSTALRDASGKLAESKKPYEDAVAILGPLRHQIDKNCLGTFAEMRDQRTAAENELASIRFELSEMKAERERISSDAGAYANEVASLENDLIAVQALKGSYNSADIESMPMVAARIAEACKDEIAAVETIEKEMKRTGAFSLGKRRRLRTELDEARNKFEAVRQKALDSIGSEIAAEMERERKRNESDILVHLDDAKKRWEAAESALANLDVQFEAVASRRETASALRSELVKKLDVLDPIAALFEASEYPKPPRHANDEMLGVLPSEITAYIDAYRTLSPEQLSSLRAGRGWIDRLEEQANTAQEAYNLAAEHVFSEQQLSSLKVAESLCSELDVRSFCRAISLVVDDLKSEYGVTLPTTSHYRHEAYLRAMLCMFYYGPPVDEGACACIDEAQDLSHAELGLIWSSLGVDAVMNLYGDINQAVYRYKGISDWKSIELFDSFSEYQLNENYRNTIEITDYCNQRLGMSALAVGLSGDDVIECTISDGIASMKSLLGEDSSLRCAVICSYGVLRELHEAGELKDPLISMDVLESGLISAISVEVAKGLEFDAVLVVERGMTSNEKYVAYTRALDYLYVVADFDIEPMDTEGYASNKRSAEEELAFQAVLSELKESDEGLSSDTADGETNGADEGVSPGATNATDDAMGKSETAAVDGVVEYKECDLAGEADSFEEESDFSLDDEDGDEVPTFSVSSLFEKASIASDAMQKKVDKR